MYKSAIELKLLQIALRLTELWKEDDEEKKSTEMKLYE